MDGFYTMDGINCMGYYTQADLPFYYSLLDSSTLCANYFCSQLGPPGRIASTWLPQRRAGLQPMVCGAAASSPIR